MVTHQEGAELLSHADGLFEELDHAKKTLDGHHLNLQAKITAVKNKPDDKEVIGELRKSLVHLETSNTPKSLLPSVLRPSDSASNVNADTGSTKQPSSATATINPSIYPITTVVVQMDSFDGSQLFDDWYWTVIHHQELFRWTDHQTLFYAAFKLRAEAARVFRNSRLLENSNATLKDFADLMGSMFPKRSDEVDVWRDIFNGSRAPGETLKQYAKGLALLFQQVEPPLTEAAKISALCRNVEHDFNESALATTREKRSFATAVDYLEACEHIRDRRKRKPETAVSKGDSNKKLNNRPFCSHHKSHGHSTEDCRARVRRLYNMSNNPSSSDHELK